MFPRLKYFTADEFNCRCGKCHGGADLMDYGLLRMLDAAREKAGIPFRINSAYRCPEHNANVGGVPGSAHTLGVAVDISARDSASRFAIVDALLEQGAERVGIAKTFVHVDVDRNKPQRVMWDY